MRSLDWKQLVGKIIHGNTCHWLVMKEISIFNAQRSTSFRILYCALVRFSKTPQSNDASEQRLGWFKTSQNYSNVDRIDGEPMEFEWNIFPGFNTLQLNSEVKSLLLRLDETPENFTGRIMFMSMFNDISCGSKDNEQECVANAKLVSLDAKRIGKGQWWFIGRGSEKKWCCISEDCPQGEWDNMAERILLEFAESGCPIFRATSPLSGGRLKSKGHGKLSIHYAADLETIETMFRIIFSANQLSLHGAIAEMCEEYETVHERTGRPVVMEQSSSSLVLSVIKTEVHLDCDDPTRPTKIFYCSNMENELKSCHNKTNRANFVRTQDFWMLLKLDNTSWRKTLQNLTQFHAVACREYTLPREEEASQPKGWIQRNTKIGPVLEVTTGCLHGKYGVEIRIMSLSRDNSQSWVRISHASNKSGAQSDQAYPVAKSLNTLLRHGHLRREDDGAIEFWRLKDYLRFDFENSQHWSHEMWKSKMAGGEGNKKRFQYCTDPSGQEILYLRALQGHSGRNLIDPSLQDNVLIPNDFFEYMLSHRMCNQFAFHHQFGIDTWRSKSEQQTDSVLSACRS